MFYFSLLLLYFIKADRFHEGHADAVLLILLIIIECVNNPWMNKVLSFPDVFLCIPVLY